MSDQPQTPDTDPNVPMPDPNTPEAPQPDPVEQPDSSDDDLKVVTSPDPNKPDEQQSTDGGAGITGTGTNVESNDGAIDLEKE